MKVFYDKQPLDGGADLLHRREKRIREDIRADPGVNGGKSCVATYSVQQEQTVIFQTIADLLHIGPIIFIAHVLEHSDGDDVVEPFVHVPVILEPDFYRQPLAHFPAELQGLLPVIGARV